MNKPTHKLGQAMRAVVEQGKRPCFGIAGLRITMASDNSANPGSLYIKNDSWDYIGKISPEGKINLRHPSLLTNEQKQLLPEVINNPEETAMSNGKVTGTCCCCGRTLTNELSIELGIGPICRGSWFPDSPTDLGELGALADLSDIPDPVTPVTPVEHTTIREMMQEQAKLDVPKILEDRLDALKTVEGIKGNDS